MPGSASGSSIGESSRTEDEEAFAAEAMVTQALNEGLWTPAQRDALAAAVGGITSTPGACETGAPRGRGPPACGEADLAWACGGPASTSIGSSNLCTTGLACLLEAGAEVTEVVVAGPVEGVVT